jgi:hypothetical protein
MQRSTNDNRIVISIAQHGGMTKRYTNVLLDFCDIFHPKCKLKLPIKNKNV